MFYVRVVEAPTPTEYDCIQGLSLRERWHELASDG